MSVYPTNFRYTLQGIVTPKNKFILDQFPNNNDATFTDQQLTKPVDLLMQYNYGATAMKQWGINSSVLTNHPDIPRASVPVLAPMGLIRVKHDRKNAIQKRAAP